MSFQVYNNTYDSAEADEAVIATAGMVAVYNGELVKTYYYSTLRSLALNRLPYFI